MGKGNETVKMGRAICFAEKTEGGWELSVIGDSNETADQAAESFAELVNARVVGRTPQTETRSQHPLDSRRWRARWQPTGPGGRNPLRPVD